MYAHELAPPLATPKVNVRFRWRLGFLHWLFVGFETLMSKPRLVRHVAPGLPPEHEHDFKPPPYYYR